MKDNFVIEVLDEEHGLEVIVYFESLGIDTRNLSGSCTRQENNNHRYYGIRNGFFDNYNIDEVENNGVKIIELPKKEEMNKVRILSAQNAQKIINCACPLWKKSLAEKWGAKIVLGEEIEVAENDYKIMRNACTLEQHKIFDEIFGKDVKEIDLRSFKSNSDLGIKLIECRENGDLQNKAFWLNQNFNWELKTDNLGVVCLVPSYK